MKLRNVALAVLSMMVFTGGWLTVVRADTMADLMPLTGDRSNLYIYVGILVGCLVAAILVVLFMKRAVNKK
ncbi:MAG: hypothetical protein II414_01210 [Erysipelotrichaceae bacterium]|nr:hypothetical protein [Erysipelotrichaceae bacterium]MBQ3385142.1 hypothetical protein [Erysipelotrichaceae bacterium]